MADKEESCSDSLGEQALGREEFSDFSLVLEDGHELKCHKVKLAEASSFFRSMFRQKWLETQTNKMKVTEFRRETVESFLDYIYTDSDLVTDQDCLKLNFDKKRLTPELLRMCHLYRVRNLQDWCTQHLVKNVEDNNAVDIWNAGDKIGNDKLKEVALDHLGRKRNKLLDVPGIKQSFECPKLMESLVTHLSERTPCNYITIKVKCEGFLGRKVWMDPEIKVKLCESVEVLRLKIDDYFYFSDLCCDYDSLKISGSGRELQNNKTLDFYGLGDGSTVTCVLRYPPPRHNVNNSE